MMRLESSEVCIKPFLHLCSLRLEKDTGIHFLQSESKILLREASSSLTYSLSSYSTRFVSLTADSSVLCFYGELLLMLVRKGSGFQLKQRTIILCEPKTKILLPSSHFQLFQRVFRNDFSTLQASTD